MPKLRNYIENGINEVRILLLGGQVLLGFSYRRTSNLDLIDSHGLHKSRRPPASWC